jgi:glycosyltransferase involved in cell wall biosynthesis
VLVRRALERPESSGVTVVTVNFNARECLEVLVHAVRKHSPSAVRIVVVDNASRDGSRAWLRAHPEIRSLRLPANVGHGLGLDLGVLISDTEFVVALDVDAFPISPRWLDTVLGPLRHGHEVAGAEFCEDGNVGRRFAHPCFLAMRRRRYLERGHSFEQRGRFALEPGARQEWHDVGEAISAREHGLVELIPTTRFRGPARVGSVFGDVVYHNGYSTRFTKYEGDVLDRVVARSDPGLAWAEALAEHFPELQVPG